MKPQTMTLTATDGAGTVVEVEVTDVKVIRTIRDGQVNAYSMARSYEGSTITATREASPPGAWADVGAAITEGFTSAYAAAIAHATTPKPLPSPDTREGLLARLNARHHSTRTPA